MALAVASPPMTVRTTMAPTTIPATAPLDKPSVALVGTFDVELTEGVTLELGMSTGVGVV